MKYGILCLLSIAASVGAQTIRPTDSRGQVRYDQNYLEYDKRTGRYVEVSPLLGKQYHKPQYKVSSDGKLQQTDAVGNPTYAKSGVLSPK